MICSVMPLILEVKLDPGDSALGSGDLEVHVAEVVLVADDVGQQDVSAAGLVLDQADRDSTDRVGDRHARVHQAQRGPADRGHRAGSVGLEDVGDDPDRVRELCRVGQNRSDRPLGQGAMADLAPAGPADRANLADREGGHVVVEHELLAIFVHDAVNPLLVGGRAEHGRDQGLSLAPLEDRRAVGPGQEADLAADRPQVVRAAAVGPLAVENQLANDPLLDRREGRLDPARRHGLVDRGLARLAPMTGRDGKGVPLFRDQLLDHMRRAGPWWRCFALA